MDEFPQRALAEFRDHSPHLGMVRQVLDVPNDGADEPGAYILHTLFGIPGSDGFEIGQRGVGESNLRGHTLFETKPGFGFGQ